MKWIKNFFNGKGLEEQLFLAALLIAVPYFVSSIIFDLIALDNFVLLTIDITFLVICLVMIFLSRSDQLRALLVNIFCLLIIAGFTFFWISAGGINGGGQYVFPVVSVLVILISKGRSSIIFAIILLAVAILISGDWIAVEGSAEYTGLLFDFILNLFMLAVLLIVFKKSLDNERSKLESQNSAIRNSNAELNIKTTELELYNRDVELISKNLEKVAERNFVNMERQNQKILEYSFINAHLVRAPLVNIIGLAELDERKNDQYESLENRAKKFDQILHKISSVLHHKD
ncbi:hypothetical protein [Ekhidna sp. To15]|uniref:hypothetical protein n=1 Tax=Ekhidna sp. To15 TaxID=3395267 RepID=UPI003F5212FC